MTTRHTRPQISHLPTGKRIFSVLTIPFVFLLVVIVFAGCGGEKKGQKEFEEGMNFFTVQQYESAVKQFAAAANLGHAEAQNKLGLCFAEGKGVKQDDTEGVKWFRKAAEQGIAESQYILGCAYLSGAGGLPVDLEEAAKWLEKAAKQGNTDAQNVLDPLKNIVVLLGSAKKGDPEAMFELGVAFYDGGCVKQDKTEAVKWFKKAAEKGESTSMFNLYVCYRNGYGVERDMNEAIKWYLKAVDNGCDTASYYELGMMYFNGIDVQIDLPEAVKWFSKGVERGEPEALKLEVSLSLGWIKQQLEAAEKGNFEAMRAIAQEYKQNRISLFPEDSRECERWIRKVIRAAEAGDGEAMYQLCTFYYKSDRGRSIEWLNKAIKELEDAATDKINTAKSEFREENTDAMFLLGQIHSLGGDLHDLMIAEHEDWTTVRKCLAKAVEWYEKAAEKGHVEAMRELGFCYEASSYERQDYAKAIEWYKKAVEKGSVNAMISLGSCYMKGHGVEKDEDEAVKWYKKAAEKGNAEAMYYLGDYYKETEKDNKEARKWYRQAAVFGFVPAKNKLNELDGN